MELPEERPYFLAPMKPSAFRKAKKRAGIRFRHYSVYSYGKNSIYSGLTGQFTKEEIEKFPRYVRRGCEYGGEEERKQLPEHNKRT
jgi:hypothetical protein